MGVMAGSGMNFLLAFLVSLIYVHLKSRQQLAVVHMDFPSIMPNSMGMAACEVFLFSAVIRTSDSIGGLILLALCIGLGAGFGCIAAMKMHLRRKH